MVEQPVIVAFVADLYFAVKIENASQAAGFRVDFIEHADDIAPADLDPTDDRVYAEPVSGRNGALIERLTFLQPALIIFDLENRSIPWGEWIQLITAVPATRRIPVLCYGAHVQVESLKAARKAGAADVVARSRFTSELTGLIAKHARVLKRDDVAESCRAPLSPTARLGLERFNRGEYFEAHESLEKAWMEDATIGRELYRAILQVAVAYYQIERGNFTGAVKMFLRLRQWIDPLPETCRGVDVARLRSEAQTVHRAILELGPEHIAEFDLSLLQPVVYQAG